MIDVYLMLKKHIIKMFKNFGVGLRAYGKAIELVFSKHLWWCLLFPIALNIVFLVAGWLGIGSLSEYVETWLENLLKIDKDSFWGAEFLAPVSNYLAGIAGGIVWDGRGAFCVCRHSRQPHCHRRFFPGGVPGLGICGAERPAVWRAARF